MKKLLIQVLVSLILFFALWLGLRNVNWVSIFHIEQASNSSEEKLGDFFWDMFKKTEKEIHGVKTIAPLDSLLSRICTSNNIDKKKIKLHLVLNEQVNAFAMPNGHLVVNSGLLKACENEAELCGVLGHEIAHIQKNHVMKKLVKEIGLSTLITMTAGNGNAEVIRQAAQVLSSSAYDRSLEKEADIGSVDYLLKAQVKPEPFADFLYKLSGEGNMITEHTSWISTHPDSKERAEYILEYSKNKTSAPQPILQNETWKKLKESIEGL